MRTLIASPAILLTLLVATRADAGTLVVLNKSEATASLIDEASGRVVATLPTGDAPHEAAVSPDGTTAVATNYGTRDAPGNSLTVVDVPGARVLRTIDLGDGRRPHGVQWLTDGRRVVVTAEGAEALLVVDVAAGRVLRRISTGQAISHMVAVTPDGARAFVANIGSGTMTAIDLKAGRKLRDVATGEGAEGIDVAPDGETVWVTNRGADTVSVVDAASFAILDTIPSSSFPIRARMTPDGKRLLVSNARSGDLTVIDTQAREVVRRVPFKARAGAVEGRLFGDRFGDSPVPIGIVVHPNGERAWVAHTNADVIAVVDLKRWEVVGALTAGKEPDGMAYSPLTVRE